MANSADPAVCSGSTLFASILNSSVMLGNYLQQTASADTHVILRFVIRKHFYSNFVRLMSLLSYRYSLNSQRVNSCGE